jgi:large repetitive protein
MDSDKAVTATFALPTPTVASFAPASGGVHATVTLTGTNLGAATEVSVGAVSAPFSVVSSTRLTFTVPAGASDGTIKVVTPAGTATSAGSFHVLPPPAIASFGPGSGPPGTAVTITGTNLGGTVGIQFGSIVTVPTSVSDTQVVFTVPPGAVTAHIRVLSTSGAATSAGTFSVTA